jgi:hypothetical protein
VRPFDATRETARHYFILSGHIDMNIRMTLYTGALLLAAVSPPGNAAVKKFDCKGRTTPVYLPADREAPASLPVETRPVLAEWQRQTLIHAAMAERRVPDAAILQALAQAVGKQP